MRIDYCLAESKLGMMKVKIGDNLYLNKKTGQITTDMTKADLITAKAEIAKLKE